MHAKTMAVSRRDRQSRRDRHDDPTRPGVNVGTAMSTTLSILAGLLALGALAMTPSVQKQLLYFPNEPSRALRATPADAGLAYEEARIATSDGETLHAWYIPADTARGVVLMFHGNAGNIGDRVGFARLFHDLGLDTLLVDYRGYGQSTGTPSEAGTYRDAEAAWRYLVETRQLPPARILLHGRSLGGAVAAYLATTVSAAGLVLDSTFTSVPDIAEALYPWLPTQWFVRIRYPTLERLHTLETPVLVLHARGDEIVPYAHGQRLAEAAGATLVTLDGSHNTSSEDSVAIYREAMQTFADRVLPASAMQPAAQARRR